MEYDSTGLYHTWARYYSPGLQRFLSEDPLGIGGGDTDLFPYVHNSPTNMIDPLGLLGMGGGAAGGGGCGTACIPPVPPIPLPGDIFDYMSQDYSGEQGSDSSGSTPSPNGSQTGEASIPGGGSETGPMPTIQPHPVLIATLRGDLLLGGLRAISRSPLTTPEATEENIKGVPRLSTLSQ